MLMVMTVTKYLNELVKTRYHIDMQTPSRSAVDCISAGSDADICFPLSYDTQTHINTIPDTTNSHATAIPGEQRMPTSYAYRPLSVTLCHFALSLL